MHRNTHDGIHGYRDTQGCVFLGNKAIFAAFLWFVDANPNHLIATWPAGRWFPWKHDSVCPIPQFGIENVRTAKMQSAEHVRQLLNDTGLGSVKCSFSPFLLSLYRDIFFLISNLSLFSFSMKPFPLVVSLL